MHLVDFITKKFVAMHGHMNVKKMANAILFHGWCYCDNFSKKCILTLRLLMLYIYGAPSKARNANVVYIWTYVWQR